MPLLSLKLPQYGKPSAYVHCNPYHVAVIEDTDDHALVHVVVGHDHMIFETLYTSDKVLAAIAALTDKYDDNDDC